ncbi:alanine--tRNA ligase [Sulfoacidibacillus thermotolerans]|uniref:Alanine--tRNA ligase n=1 Tax=Sulfoacidibacillus thermotolerans TaxID=1765684 RepID=A0A2U3D7G5_SULT2|nr:alanine--tRNA ligase [Sulfoacidibacillus thermotolerans]PWI57201.1 alanine--tRNA ligase [Sulfoacidibacillus thermotolerans]
MKGSELRRKYVEFFREKGHDIMPSASLVPQDDASLLWINSGMAPLKKYFDGRVVPANPRMTNSQKCIRTNDIENVGKTARHQTFFEMLGNFSIGDYFKREAIHWAWEFLTDRLHIAPERLSVTIHPEDDEAFLIWHREIGIPEEKILRVEDNFWDIGEGPCGPNSEIFFDRGPGVGCGREDCDAACDCDRHLEIWNLVFSQYNHNPDGSYTPLPKKNIDTGMGLERTASVLQNVATNFDTDLFRPIIDRAAELIGVRYGSVSDIDTKLKIIADHVRTVAFSITDGVSPSNEGRGYVIRRLLRRAVRSGKQLGYNQPFLYRLVQVVGEIMEDYYPEVAQKRQYTERIIRMEEERFFETLSEGEALLTDVITRVKAQQGSVISGPQAFKLYDTYGFPIDLTEEIAAESGLQVDREGFLQALEEQRVRARNARQEVDSMQVQSEVLHELTVSSEFVGYTESVISAKIEWMLVNGEQATSAHLGERVKVVLDRTPFYAESGGQVADRGMLIHPDFELRVLDVQKAPHGQHVHDCEVVMGTAVIGETVTAAIDVNARADITKNHTATHLLHKALREVLGEHVAQAGSLVLPERLRFDFSHVGSLSRAELEQVERLVNEQIWRDEPVTIEEMGREEAKSLGAMALFGEKYGDIVRVVKAGTYSIELCGGCHVNRTGQIGLFKLVQEGGIGSGVRRIEAVTGKHAYEFVVAEERLLTTVADSLRSSIIQVPQRIESLLGHAKQLEREVESLTGKLGSLEALQLLERVEPMPGGSMLVAKLQGLDVDGLRVIVDALKARKQDLLMILGSAKEGKAAFVVYVPKELQAKGFHAGKLVKEVAAIAGGSGGGRPDLAQAGGKLPEQLDAALETARKLLAAQVTQ